MTQSSFRVDDARGLDSMSTDRRMQLSCGLREAREDGVRKRGGAGDGREGEEEEVGEAQRGGCEVARGEEEGVALERVGGGPARAEAGEERRRDAEAAWLSMAASNSDEAKW